MNRHWRTALRGGLLAIWSTTFLAPLAAESPTQSRREAQRLVAEALFHESLGLPAERERLLREAAQKAPEAESLKWARAEVKQGDRWVSIDDVPQLHSDDAALALYTQQRDKAADTAVGQFNLARYCERHRLPAQARAHLVRVLDHDTNHAEARRALGFVARDGRWVHQDDITLAARAAEQSQANFERWRKRIAGLRQDLASRATSQRAAAAKRLGAIDDPGAIPAIEVLLGYGSTSLAEPAISALGAMTAPEASLALARLAVYGGTPEARELSANQLKARSYEQYVPQLLAAMTSTIELRADVEIQRDGRLRHRQILVREQQDQHQVLVRGTEYRRQFIAGGDGGFAQWQAAIDMARQNSDSARTIAMHNLATLEQNERIAKTLVTTTGELLSSDPKEWWDWWNTYNDMKFTGAKPVYTQVALRSVNVLDGLPSFGAGGSAIPTGGRSGSECLVAGTPVATSRGAVSIEKVQVGDLVLAQDIQTGELAYKPVLRATITPIGPLLRIEAGQDESFRSTEGHLFWVSGEGWRQARELKSGMQLHTPRGAVAVSQISREEPQLTYNLVVADFHTYFAGESRVLCHDNTLRRPTQAIVPGVVVK